MSNFICGLFKTTITIERIIHGRIRHLYLSMAFIFIIYLTHGWHQQILYHKNFDNSLKYAAEWRSYENFPWGKRYVTFSYTKLVQRQSSLKYLGLGIGTLIYLLKYLDWHKARLNSVFVCLMC